MTKQQKQAVGEITERTRAAHSTVREQIERTTERFSRGIDRMKERLERRREPRADLDLPASTLRGGR